MAVQRMVAVAIEAGLHDEGDEVVWVLHVDNVSALRVCVCVRVFVCILGQ